MVRDRLCLLFFVKSANCLLSTIRIFSLLWVRDNITTPSCQQNVVQLKPKRIKEIKGQ